jgi:hypothetical protein
MSSRSALRGVVLAAAGAAAMVALAVALSPKLRRRALAALGRGSAPEPEQPTHIVLPDRVREARWDEIDEAVEEGRSIGSGDVALTGA